MPKTDIQTLILQRALNVLRAGGKGAAGPEAQAADSSLAVCVDLQNLHYFLSSACGVPATRVDTIGLIRAIATRHGLQVKRFHVFTGIHDEREVAKKKAMERRLSWFRKGGAVITAIPLSYAPEGDGWRAKEKGVDVAIGAELVRLAHDGWKNVLVITQDRDLAAAAAVAKAVSAGRMTIMSLRLDGERVDRPSRCALGGIGETTKISVTRDDVRFYTRPDRAPIEVSSGSAC